MSTTRHATILIVTGLRDHVEDHWQTHLERKLSSVRKVVSVPPLETDKLSCAARVAAVQQAIEIIEGPLIVVAHSAGVIMMVHWAQKHTRKLEGVLLAAPPDFESPLPAGDPTPESLQANRWLPLPRHAQPVRSVVAPSAGAGPPGAPAGGRGLPPPTTLWPRSIASRRWRATGAASWSTWGRWATSTRRQALASGCWPNSSSSPWNRLVAATGRTLAWRSEPGWRRGGGARRQ